MFDLQEIEAIKRLKYKYMRCLDNKLWDEMAECFAEDATCSYSGGKYEFSGREAILKVHVKNVKLDETVDLSDIAGIAPPANRRWAKYFPLSSTCPIWTSTAALKNASASRR